MPERMAICPGSFDPLTNGHETIMRRGLALFDRIIVAVTINLKKTPLFTTEERMAMVRASFPDEPRIEIEALDGLLAAYARSRGAVAILRGLRAPSDFEYELQMAQMNRHLHPDLDTVFLASDADGSYVSSSIVKEVARLGGHVADMVPPHVSAALAAKFSGRP
ncbi:MAG: pantetheine-phosphate adenylyltransferase [Deltaproteobacteria bacterium HGW-Deltaproteobacteria-14]|jgi:pantetheine-phosphate adenylyltransferase|nr:MAG: pantetheine-phosphate adenylyltransferase [Deltaproteobacteria bacterium HGW-Deltaproteobacteria-14]